MSGCVETVPPNAARNRSNDARRSARVTKALWQNPVVGCLNRDASVAGAAARDGLAVERSRRQMAPQELEKIESAPGNGMAPAASNRQYLVRRLIDRHRDDPGRAVAKTPFRRCSCLGGADASRRKMAPQRLQKIEFHPGKWYGPGSLGPPISGATARPDRSPSSRGQPGLNSGAGAFHLA